MILHNFFPLICVCVDTQCEFSVFFILFKEIMQFLDLIPFIFICCMPSLHDNQDAQNLLTAWSCPHGLMLSTS